MAFNAKRLQVYAKVPGGYGEGEEYRLIESHPALRLRGEGADYPVYIQDGQVWDENGNHVSLPSWFWDEIRKCSPRALASVGWDQEPPSMPAKALEPQARRLGGTESRLRKHLQEKAERIGGRAQEIQPAFMATEGSDGHDHSND